MILKRQHNTHGQLYTHRGIITIELTVKSISTKSIIGK